LRVRRLFCEANTTPDETATSKGGNARGRWRGIPTYVDFDFEGADAGIESFPIQAEPQRIDGGCGVSQAFVLSPDGGAISTNAGVPCPLLFTDAGLSLFVPQVAPGPGVLSMSGWPPFTITECAGTGFCHLVPPSSFGPSVSLETSVAP
jgi:hypothetical protein